jgi:hypothetical protein
MTTTQATVTQRLIAAVDASGYPAASAGPQCRIDVIAHDVMPLGAVLEGLVLTDEDVQFLSWIIGFGESEAIGRIVEAVRAGER